MSIELPFKIGDIAFFKKAKKSSRETSVITQFPGHCFALVLGVVPPFMPDPPAEHLLRMIGTTGFISFDDVKEFLGDVVAADVIKKFEEKYWKGVKKEEPTAIAPEEKVN